MKVCILCCPVKDSFKTGTQAVVSAFEKAISENGHDVRIIDIKRESETKLIYYDYILLVTNPLGFFSCKVDSSVAAFLKSAGDLSGKKSGCFVYGRCLSAQKMLLRLMDVMEEQGMFVRISDYLSNPDRAYAVGLRLKI